MRLLEGGAAVCAYRNGTESRYLLPLWNGAARGIGSVRLLEGGAAVHACHNGTESRDLLPLWNGVIFTSGEAHYMEAQSNQ